MPRKKSRLFTENSSAFPPTFPPIMPPLCNFNLRYSEVLQQLSAASADHLQALTSYDLCALMFRRSAFVPLKGINVHVTRGRYIGEDGFKVCLKPLSPFGHFPRPKLAGVEPSVKAAMLKSSHVLPPTTTLPVPLCGLHCMQSGSSLNIE